MWELIVIEHISLTDIVPFIFHMIYYLILSAAMGDSCYLISLKKKQVQHSNLPMVKKSSGEATNLPYYFKAMLFLLDHATLSTLYHG